MLDRLLHDIAQFDPNRVRVRGQGQTRLILSMLEDIAEHILQEALPELGIRSIMKMLSNVLKHGKEQARLTLTSDADTIRVELRNIVQQPIQHLDQLASRFYSENLSDTEESSGLGLYIIQNFVEILGGDLQLATEADWFILTITLRKKA